MNRPRGLCWNCYYTPGVKALYPSTSKFAPHAARGEWDGDELDRLCAAAGAPPPPPYAEPPEPARTAWRLPAHYRPTAETEPEAIREAQRADVRAYLARHPGATAPDVGAAVCLPTWSAERRLAELGGTPFTED